MTPDEVKRMKELCRQIAVEYDQQKFTQLLIELNELLEKKHGRLDQCSQSDALDPHTTI